MLFKMAPGKCRPQSTRERATLVPLTMRKWALRGCQQIEIIEDMTLLVPFLSPIPHPDHFNEASCLDVHITRRPPGNAGAESCQLSLEAYLFQSLVNTY